MAYRVETTTRAERDLALIYKRIEADASVQAAQWFNGIEAATTSLGDYPRRNPLTPENKAWRHLLYGKKPYVYRIIYKIKEATATVYILHIRSPRRDRMGE